MIMDMYISPGQTEEEEGAVRMVGMGGPCHHYGGGAPPQQTNTRARGTPSQKNDNSISQAEQQCQVNMDKGAGQAEQQSSETAGKERLHEDQPEQQDVTTTTTTATYRI